MNTTNVSVMQDDDSIVTATDTITEKLKTNQKSHCVCPAMEICGMGSEKSEVKDSSNWYDENTTCCSTTSGPRHLEKLRARQQQDVNKRYTSSSFLTEDEKDIFDKEPLFTLDPETYWYWFH